MMIGNIPNRKHPEFYLWKGMLDRTTKFYNKDFAQYGAKGIGCDPRWFKFENFIEDMGPRPSREHSIDRIDGNKGYSKFNCRWATKAEQTANRITSKQCRRGHPWTKSSTIFTTNGKTKTRRCRICKDDRREKVKLVGGRKAKQ